MKWIILTIFLSMIFSCSMFQENAGKGVITETTNVGVARGLVASSMGAPVELAFVSVFRAQDIPSAWEGQVYATDTTGTNGTWSVDSLYEADYQAVAITPDSSMMGQVYFPITTSQDSITELKITLEPTDTLRGKYDDYAVVMDTLTQGWLLRANLRGLGANALLSDNGTYEFPGVPRGLHYVRVQRIDGIPGHETTLWQDWILVE